MKILRGDLTETRYAFPKKEGDAPLKVISNKTYKENAVAYMADELGLHRVTNQGGDFAVSLHCRNPVRTPLVVHLSGKLTCNSAVYTPPNVAKKGCHVFDQETGRKSHVSGCHYHSAYGKLLEA